MDPPRDSPTALRAGTRPHRRSSLQKSAVDRSDPRSAAIAVLQQRIEAAQAPHEDGDEASADGLTHEPIQDSIEPQHLDVLCMAPEERETHHIDTLVQVQHPEIGCASLGQRAPWLSLVARPLTPASPLHSPVCRCSRRMRAILWRR